LTKFLLKALQLRW